jgi:GH25 family lysozyme M1 (1,4-beta-N-acetylmuramidase)
VVVVSGVDIAAVDGDGTVDWARAAAGGVTVAYLNATPGNSVWNQAPAARAAGITVGPYIFPTVRKGLFPSDQMRRAISLADYQPGDLPWCLDVELPKGLKGTGMSRPDVCTWFVTAYREMARIVGHSPLLYSSVRVLDTNDADTLSGGLDSLAPEAPLCLARYDGRTETNAPMSWGAGNYWIHQFAGDQKNVAGIRQADVDAFSLMRPGETGARAKWLQAKLSVPVTGKMDDASVAVLRDRQKLWGLVPDGIIGPKTFARVSRL